MLLKFGKLNYLYFGLKTCFRLYHLSTIFAVSSGQGKCGVAVIRVSGLYAGQALKALTSLEKLPPPRHVLLKTIINPNTRDVLDKGLVIWFPAPRSFTGEDSCEFQVHGGLAVVASILNALKSLPSVRLAEPGEFTKRAFYNGKLDLTEVEGLSDLLAAETEVQRRQAVLQSQGQLKNTCDKWKRTLTHSLANLEAYIEFDETDSLENNIINLVVNNISQLHKEIEQHVKDIRKGERLRNGVKTVILGKPNVGKSSLFNILCQRKVAIVSPIEGTTRDVLETMLDINGYPLLLADTAGLRRQTIDIIEQEGITRALSAYETSDLVLLIIDCIYYLHWHKKNPDKDFKTFLKAYIKSLNVHNLLHEFENQNAVFQKHCILVGNKMDLVPEQDLCFLKDLKIRLVSCKSNLGFPELLNHISKKLEVLCGTPSKEHPTMNQLRHEEHLRKCLFYLQNFLSSVHMCDADCVLLAEDLRKALLQLGKITGAVSTEEILELIFKQFCIGK